MSCAVRAAFEGVDLEVPEGAVYALLGPRRAGKTTCLRRLLNVTAPGAGSAEVLGVDSRRLGPREFERIAYLAADQEMPEAMTVGHFLSFLRAYYPSWDRGLETELVRRFQLPLDKKLGQLSLATQRKAALTSSLAYRPSLIALDEPFRGLDGLARGELAAAVLERVEGATVLICAEDAGEVEDFATHAGWLEGGRLRISEALDSLRARCRRIALRFDNTPDLPLDWPAAWIARETGPAAVSYIDTQFHSAGSIEEARRRLPGVVDATVTSMSAAEILGALAAAWRAQ